MTQSKKDSADMFINPKITFMCVTYNRSAMIRNLLLSFSYANLGYDNFEWLVLEHDTSDDTVDFLKNIDKDPLFESLKGKIKILYQSDRDYLELLTSLNIDVSTPLRQRHALFGKLRNDLFKESQGEILIDLPDDHQFITRGNFCQNIVDIFNDRIENIGYDDIGTLTFRTRLGYRITKQSNSHGRAHTTSSDIDYYLVNSESTCDDWGAISRSNFIKIGNHNQLENENNNTIDKWNSDKFPAVGYHHITMLEKTKKAKLKKLMTKVPIMNDCLWGSAKDVSLRYKNYKEYTKNNKSDVIFKILDSKNFKEYLKPIDRCLSIEEYEGMMVEFFNYRTKKI